MGNKGGKLTEDHFAALPDSPTLRMSQNHDYRLVVTKDPLRGPERLPKRVLFRLTPSHCEFWRADDQGEPSGARPLRAISYFNVLGWGHSTTVFRMIESCEVVVQGGKMVKQRRVFEFSTRDGKEITSKLSLCCHAIVADIETKKSEQKLVEKEREWNEYWMSKEEEEQDPTSPGGSPDVMECLSPLAGAEPTGSLAVEALRFSESPESPIVDLLACSLDADIERIRSESPVPSPVLRSSGRGSAKPAKISTQV
jgi:hypothetical protein